MIDIPKELYNKQIMSYITELVKFDNAQDFDSLDELSKDSLIQLASESLDYDFDTVMSKKTTSLIAKRIRDNTGDYDWQIISSVKNDLHEHFSPILNYFIDQQYEYQQNIHNMENAA